MLRYKQKTDVDVINIYFNVGEYQLVLDQAGIKGPLLGHTETCLNGPVNKIIANIDMKYFSVSYPCWNAISRFFIPKPNCGG